MLMMQKTGVLWKIILNVENYWNVKHVVILNYQNKKQCRLPSHNVSIVKIGLKKGKFKFFEANISIF